MAKDGGYWVIAGDGEGWRLLGDARREVARFPIGGELPRLCAVRGVEGVERVAIGIDHAIGDDEAPVDGAAGLVGPTRLAVGCPKRVDGMVARSNKDRVIGNDW